MNNIMDERLKILRDKKQKVKESQMEKNAMDAKEIRSGILLREKTKCITEDEIMAKV